MFSPLQGESNELKEENEPINRYGRGSQPTSNLWHVSLLLWGETIFPGIKYENVMQKIPVFLWVTEELLCSWQATDKRLECLTVHLIATVDSELRHGGW